MVDLDKGLSEVIHAKAVLNVIWYGRIWRDVAFKFHELLAVLTTRKPSQRPGLWSLSWTNLRTNSFPNLIKQGTQLGLLSGKTTFCDKFLIQLSVKIVFLFQCWNRAEFARINSALTV